MWLMSEQERKRMKAINSAALPVIQVFWYNTAKFESLVFLYFFTTSLNYDLLDEWVVS